MHCNMHCNAEPVTLNHGIRHFSIPPSGKMSSGPQKGISPKIGPSFGSAGVFQRGKLAPFLGLSGILSGASPLPNIQHATPPSTNADNNNYQIFSHGADDENYNFKKLKTYKIPETS